MSEPIQPISTFGRKQKKKDPGSGGIMTLGMIGIAACLLAIAIVFANMSA